MTYKSEIFFVRNLIPFSGGIVLVYDMKSIILLQIIHLFVWAIFGLLLTANILYKKYSLYKLKATLGIINYIFWFAFGSLACLLNRDSVDERMLRLGEKTILKGWIASEPQIRNGLARMELNVTSVFDSLSFRPTNAKLLASVKLDSKLPLNLRYGDELVISGKCSKVDGPRNPGEFDFQSWLSTKNICFQIYCDQRGVDSVSMGRGNPVINYAHHLRTEQVKIFRNLIKDDQAFAVASTLVLGYRSDLSRETLSSYSKTGTMHALSVSGAHVGIIYLLLNWVFFFLNRHKICKLAAICFVLWWYSLLTGFSPSVLRSAIMLTIFLVAKTFGKSTNSYNTLAFTAFCLLVYNPFLIWDVGFQLSFFAVFGLIFIQPKIYTAFSFNNKLVDVIWSAVAMSLAAQLTTFPHSIYYFHQFPIYFVLSNLFILLPLSAMMYLGISILIVKAYFLAPVFEWIIIFTNTGLKWMGNLPLAGITGIWLSKWQLALLVVILSSFALAVVYRKKKVLYAGLILLVTLQGFNFKSQMSAIKQKKILFFSLKRNYAVAFIDGNRATLVTDLALQSPAYEFSLKPGLEQLRVEKINFVNWETELVVGAFVKLKKQISFHGFNLMLLDKQLDHNEIRNLPTFDVVWLHNTPQRNLVNLRNHALFKSVVVDGTNLEYAIKNYQEQADKIEVTLHHLKKNTSYLVDLN